MKFEHAIVGCLVERDGTFLIVQESKAGRAGLYNMPSGHIEGTETLVEAAVRETLEESGYKVRIDGLVGIYQSIFPDMNLNVSGPIFHAVVVGGEATPSLEHPESRWVTADELTALHNAGKIWTKYPASMVQDYLRRGMVSLDYISSKMY